MKVIEWLRKIFGRCQHPDPYQEPYRYSSTSGEIRYKRCKICKEVYVVERIVKTIKKEES